MAKFTSENQPQKGRGKSERTKILDAMKRQGRGEEGFYDVLVARAFDPEDNFAYKELLQRIAPLRKAVMPDIEFELDLKASPQEKAAQILNAVSQAIIPPDIGMGLINAIRNVIDIEANTELKERIEKLEAMINGSAG
jgi:hypothetical protein